MSRADRILKNLRAAFAPAFLDLVDESHMHAVASGSESHFRLVLVSARFEALTRVARSRLVHDVLADDLKGGLHALSHRLYTPEEWAERNEAIEVSSPPCLGGSKADR
ncbi:MAG: BolA family transcriptional regulator [Bdellovibrionaceae bacterium]|nr:BolA family transcriptional regulator [Pseudobdellovibrionaceae bacterium]